MTEKNYLKKLRSLLHQVSLNIYPDQEEKTYTDIIKKYALIWIKIKEENGGSTQVRYRNSDAYIDLYNLIRRYNTSEEVIKRIYNEELIKIYLHRKNDSKQEPIVRRDNKGVRMGNGYGGNKNMTRYPKKNRPLHVWKKFYEMFPREAELDNWNGKTSTKMK